MSDVGPICIKPSPLIGIHSEITLGIFSHSDNQINLDEVKVRVQNQPSQDLDFIPAQSLIMWL